MPTTAASRQEVRLAAHPLAARPPLQTVDWATVVLDPEKMSQREREGYEYFVDLIAAKLIELEARC